MNQDLYDIEQFVKVIAWAYENDIGVSLLRFVGDEFHFTRAEDRMLFIMRFPHLNDRVR